MRVFACSCGRLRWKIGHIGGRVGVVVSGSPDSLALRACCGRRPTLAAPLRFASLGTSPGLLRSPGEGFSGRVVERRPAFAGAVCNSSPAPLGRWVASEASEPEGP
ncbi:MAG: hypothetical protein ACYTFH_10465, partial [Planctomycetota bacterium]